MAEAERKIDEVLAICLEQLAAGMAPAECFEQYPGYAGELAPLLALAGDIQSAGTLLLSPGARARGRERMHRALDARRAHSLIWLPLWEQAAALVLIVVSLAAAWLSWPGHHRLPVAPTSAATAGPAQLATATAGATLPAPTVMASPQHQPVTTQATAGATATHTATATATDTPSPTRTAQAPATPTASPGQNVTTGSYAAMQASAAPGRDVRGGDGGVQATPTPGPGAGHPSATPVAKPVPATPDDKAGPVLRPTAAPPAGAPDGPSSDDRQASRATGDDEDSRAGAPQASPPTSHEDDGEHSQETSQPEHD